MLKNIIHQLIKIDGFITIADYMRLCLLHPEHGYYTTRQPFGAHGDFTTSPEISQLFGEMLGIWAVLEWQHLGSPKDFNLVELGPGRGTLMADLLRSIAHVKEFNKAVHVRMIDASPQLRQKQQDALSAFSVQKDWHETIDDLSFDKPLIVIANEFFDAMPIRQFIMKDGTWYERVIILEQDELVWSTQSLTDESPELPDITQTRDGDIVEIFTESEHILDQLCINLKLAHGSMAIIDYGDHITPRFGDTLQALKNHKPIDALQAWDHADITAHVDFQRLEMMAHKHSLKTQFMTQREFLKSSGIDIRVQKLRERTSEDDRLEALNTGYFRLVDPGQMGYLFKVLMVKAT